MWFSFNIAFYLFAQERKKNKKHPGWVTSEAHGVLQAVITGYFALVLLTVTTSPLLGWKK